MNEEEIERYVLEKIRGKKSFCLSKDLRSFFNYLSAEESQWLIKAIFAYADGETIGDPKEMGLPPIVAAALDMAMKSIRENNERYAESVKNGIKGAKKRWEK